MRRTRLVACLAVFASTCVACLGPAPDEDTSAELRTIDLPIVGLLDVSTSKPGYPPEPGRAWCGATLIAPRVAVTAKSCLTFAQGPGGVRFASELGDAVAVAIHHAGEPPAGLRPTHAGWSPPDDFAAIVLDRDLPVTAEELRAIRGAPLDPRPRAEGGDNGRPVTIVGYGVDVISPPGGRRALSSWIGSIAERTFELAADGEQPCLWDTGDPVFAGAEIVGVVSYTFDAPTFDRRGHHVLCRPRTNTRIDVHRDVVQRALDDASARADTAGPDTAAAPAPEACPWAGDGVCDEPALCAPGTDGDDCGGQV